MKKYYLILLLLICSMSGFASEVKNPSSLVYIEFQCQAIDYHDPIKDAGIKEPRTPLYQPNVGYAEHTLYLFDGCSNSIVSLIDNTGNNVFSTFVQEDPTVISLPTGLSGTYELRIIRGNYMFVGEIEI